jgi:hypothetical protein
VTRRRLAAITIVLIGAAAPALARRAPSDPARVVAVYPSTHRVPSNLLRIYVEFSSPMQTDWAQTHLRLLDDKGRRVERAFLETDEELWDPGQRRLTMLFDPGRVKRGIKSNLEMGAPLVEGRRYYIVVDSGWPNARGVPLVQSVTHELVVGPFDGTSPDPRRWTLSSPRGGTRDSLVVRFDEPLDHALAARLITVVNESGTRVAGVGRLDPGDTAWVFTPESPWSVGAANLHVSASLEDLAGNSVARVFDTDLDHGGRSAESESRADVVLVIRVR